MTCQDYKDMMMAYLDEQLGEQDSRTFEMHLESCSRCRAELEEFRELKRLTDDVKLLEPEERIWQQYWSGVYNRIERGIGWILLSVCGILLVIYLGFKAIEEIIKDPTVGLLLKAALLGFIAAVAILLVSVLRERLYFWKKDRYKDVRR
jgi:predicted anti-sigma-YlaC factor YlaD